MSLAAVLICVGALLFVLVVVGDAYAREVLADLFATLDRRTHIAECVERERMRSGVAWLEAWALQADEIAALPETEPHRRLA